MCANTARGVAGVAQGVHDASMDPFTEMRVGLTILAAVLLSAAVSAVHALA